MSTLRTSVLIIPLLPINLKQKSQWLPKFAFAIEIFVRVVIKFYCKRRLYVTKAYTTERLSLMRPLAFINKIQCCLVISNVTLKLSATGFFLPLIKFPE